MCVLYSWSDFLSLQFSSIKLCFLAAVAFSLWIEGWQGISLSSYPCFWLSNHCTVPFPNLILTCMGKNKEWSSWFNFQCLTHLVLGVQKTLWLGSDFSKSWRVQSKHTFRGLWLPKYSNNYYFSMCKLNIIESLAALPEQVEFLCRSGQLTFPNFLFLMRQYVLQDWSCLVSFLPPLSAHSPPPAGGKRYLSK